MTGFKILLLRVEVELRCWYGTTWKSITGLELLRKWIHVELWLWLQNITSAGGYGITFLVRNYYFVDIRAIVLLAWEYYVRGFTETYATGFKTLLQSTDMEIRCCYKTIG